MRSNLIGFVLFILCPLFQAEDIQVTLVAPDPAMSEGATDTASVTLTRTGNATNPLTVALSFTAGTAGLDDLASVPSEVTFPAGSSTTTFTLTAASDAIEEENESFAIGVTPGAGYVVGASASATMTIHNSPGALPLNTVVEGSIGSPGDRDQFTLTITTAGWYLIDEFGSGVDGSGYTLSDGLLRLYTADGVALLASDDDSGPGLDGLITKQLQPGTYLVEVAGYSDARTGTYGLKVGQVPPIIIIAANDGQLIEGSTDTGAITLIRMGDTSNSLSVALSFTAGTADAADLQEIPTVATFAAGASTTNVALTAVDDGIEEDDETFTIGIAAGSGYEIGSSASAQKSIAGPTGILPLNRQRKFIAAAPAGVTAMKN